MNLSDLLRHAETAFGSCQSGGGECRCNTCKAKALLEMAWTSGKNSGRQGAIQREEQKVRFTDWKWNNAAIQELERFAAERLPDSVDAKEFVRNVWERAEL